VATPNPLDAVIALAKRRGFVFQAGEIYGGSRSAWDYGPLGTALKENIKRQWWQFMVQGREDIVGLDSSVILPRKVWEASTPTSGTAPTTSLRRTKRSTATRL
jgi:glycyl-tRNA synthetase